MRATGPVLLVGPTAALIAVGFACGTGDGAAGRAVEQAQQYAGTTRTLARDADLPARYRL